MGERIPIHSGKQLATGIALRGAHHQDKIKAVTEDCTSQQPRPWRVGEKRSVHDAGQNIATLLC
jgi:hypothetical protein